jgi:hypothetical protein
MDNREGEGDGDEDGDEDGDGDEGERQWFRVIKRVGGLRE